MGPLLNGAATLQTWDLEKVEELNAFFAKNFIVRDARPQRLDRKSEARKMHSCWIRSENA